MATIDETRHLQLVNYVLDEMSLSERHKLEAELRVDQELARELSLIRAAVGLAETALAKEPLPKLANSIQRRLNLAMGARPVYSQRQKFSVALVAALLVVVVGIIFKNTYLGTKDQLAPAEVAQEEIRKSEPAPPAAASAEPPALKAEGQIGATIMIAGTTADFAATETPGAKMDSAAADRSTVEDADSAPQPMAEETEPEADAFATTAPARVAMMATEVGLKDPLVVKVLNFRSADIKDCFREGYHETTFLKLRLFIGRSEKVAHTETAKASQIPMAQRLCITEVIENTVFKGAGEGGSFTLTIRPIGNSK